VFAIRAPAIFMAARNPALLWGGPRRNDQSEIPRCALMKVTRRSSFPRKRESSSGPPLGGGDECHDFHFYG